MGRFRVLGGVQGLRGEEGAGSRERSCIDGFQAAPVKSVSASAYHSVARPCELETTTPRRARLQRTVNSRVMFWTRTFGSGRLRNLIATSRPVASSVKSQVSPVPPRPARGEMVMERIRVGRGGRAAGFVGGGELCALAPRRRCQGICRRQRSYEAPAAPTAPTHRGGGPSGSRGRRRASARAGSRPWRAGPRASWQTSRARRGPSRASSRRSPSRRGRLGRSARSRRDEKSPAGFGDARARGALQVTREAPPRLKFERRRARGPAGRLPAMPYLAGTRAGSGGLRGPP